MGSLVDSSDLDQFIRLVSSFKDTAIESLVLPPRAVFVWKLRSHLCLNIATRLTAAGILTENILTCQSWKFTVQQPEVSRMSSCTLKFQYGWF